MTETDPEKLAMAAEIVALRGAAEKVIAWRKMPLNEVGFGDSMRALEQALSLKVPELAAAVQGLIEVTHRVVGHVDQMKPMGPLALALSRLDAAMGKK